MAWRSQIASVLSLLPKISGFIKSGSTPRGRLTSLSAYYPLVGHERTVTVEGVPAVDPRVSYGNSSGFTEQ